MAATSREPHRRASIISALLLFAGLAGCAYRTPPVRYPAQLPGARALCLSDVAVTFRGRDADPAVAAAARQQVAGWLAEGAWGQARRGAPTRARVEVEFGAHWSVRPRGIVGLLAVFLGAAAGLEIERQHVRVDVTLETDGMVVRGHGQASQYGGVYASAERRALATALDAALAAAADLAHRMPPGHRL